MQAAAGDVLRFQLCCQFFNRFVGTGEPGNCLTGTIAEAIYLGELAQYSLKDSAGLSFRVAELNPAALHQSGVASAIAVAPDDVMVLKV